MSVIVKERIVITEALASYWGCKAKVGNRHGHWVSRYRDIKQYAVSEAVDSLLQQPVNVPYMVKGNMYKLKELTNK